MTKYKVIAAVICLMAMTVAVMAKDKEYQEGKLTRLAITSKGWEHDAFGSGRHMVYHYSFHVQVGDTQYVGSYSSRGNVTKKWQLGPVEVRFEKKSSVIAHTSYMYLKNPDSGKEIETIVGGGLGKGKTAEENEITE